MRRRPRTSCRLKRPKIPEIIAKIESRPYFRNLESVERQEEGYCQITYDTSDNAAVEIKIDAATGPSRIGRTGAANGQPHDHFVNPLDEFSLSGSDTLRMIGNTKKGRGGWWAM